MLTRYSEASEELGAIDFHPGPTLRHFLNLAQVSFYKSSRIRYGKERSPSLRSTIDGSTDKEIGFHSPVTICITTPLTLRSFDLIRFSEVVIMMHSKKSFWFLKFRFFIWVKVGYLQSIQITDKDKNYRCLYKLSGTHFKKTKIFHRQCVILINHQCQNCFSLLVFLW